MLSPEIANNVLYNCREIFYKTKSQKRKAIRTCFYKIKSQNDYSFLKRLGYTSFDENKCINAFEKLWVEFDLFSTFLFPFGLFLSFVTYENPLYGFVDKVIDAPIITTEELFLIIQQLTADQQEEVLQKIAISSNSLLHLREAVRVNDCAKFIHIIDENQIDTTALGQRLALYKELPNPKQGIVSPEHALQGLSMIYQTYPSFCDDIKNIRLEAPSIFQGYITKKNCYDKFVQSREVLDMVFVLSARMYYSILNLQHEPLLAQCLNVFRNDEDHMFLAETLRKMHREDIMQFQPTDNDGISVIDMAPLPLQKAPTCIADIYQKEKKFSLFFDKLAQNKDKPWVQKTDKECFLYLLRVTDIRPRPLRRIIWLGDKWELKCLMDVLYPNRKKKEKPDYGDMESIFCKPNGDSFNLKDTPLQRHKGTVNDPIQAEREERLIRHFKGILGVD